MFKETSFLYLSTVFGLAKVAARTDKGEYRLMLKFGGSSQMYLLPKRTKVRKGVQQGGSHQMFKV